ncbi:MAG: alpha/beta fold hydrolase [bacterium]|nr:alpha/beta fold hydrolase [bacterium]MDZ4285623.1 alpha/beta fold hydrolase [Candidatus Sungbacteria bacterium]
MKAVRTHIFSLRSFMMILIGVGAFATGVFSALPTLRKDFAEIGFADTTVMAEVADTVDTRARGLSGRRSLPEFNGMLFVVNDPSQAGIWMKEMQFPIDILWIKDGIVIDMQENALVPAPGAPKDSLPIYRTLAPADFVLEVNAGFSSAHHVRIGDRVSIKLHGYVYANAQPNEDGEMRLVGDLASLPLGHEYFMDTLGSRVLQGNNFQVRDIISASDHYNKYAITYTSGDLTISGVMNVPKDAPPASGFPVLILNHGLIAPPLYTTGRGSRREQDFFASNGYITIHPDYRGHASSSPNTAVHHDFYVSYTEDVLALLDAIERSAPPYMDEDRIGMWGHSMGGGIAARIMALRSDVKAFVLFAPVSADVEDNFFELTSEEIAWLHDMYGPAGDPIYRKMSPIEYFGEVSAPVQIHHGDADTAVPLLFSQKIYDALRQNGKKAEFFIYPGEKHELVNEWQLAANRALQFFDHYVKNQ